jgi:tetratricopeptide (TPR) repeat protein
MSNSIFFSYSWRDNLIAMRIYADMVRSHLKVWRDQIDGSPTGDFVEEFNAKIDECDYFLILDSPNYRHRSNWCLEELKRFSENKSKKGGEFIVCLLKEEGDWRKQFQSAEHEALFSEINREKFYKFFHDGTYDNEAVYKQSMSSICSMFDERFVPWNKLPEDRDLEDELNASDVKLTDDDRNIVLKGYDYIRHEIKRHRNVKKHFELWIDDCKGYGLNLLFPRLVYYIWLADDEHERKYDKECYAQLEQLVQEFPEEPRCHYNLGLMASRLGEKDDKVARERNMEAVSALRKTIDLMNQQKDDWLKQHLMSDVRIATATAYMNLYEFGTAWDYLTVACQNMLDDNRFNFRVVRLMSLCLDQLGNLDLCISCLNDLVGKFPLESELYAELGFVFIKKHQYDEGLKYFEKAYTLAPLIQNGFYLLLCDFRTGTMGYGKEEFANFLLSRPNAAPEDDHWKGAICHYILEDDAKAHQVCPGEEYLTFYS